MSKFHPIWSTIAQESNLGRKERILGENHVFQRPTGPFSFELQKPPVGQCPTETFSPMFFHGSSHILLTGYPIDHILFPLHS
jgi:hypothetical protein